MIPFEEISFNKPTLSIEQQKLKDASAKFFKKASQCINCIGPILSFMIVIFFFILVHTYFTNILPFWRERLDEKYTTLLYLLGFHFSISWLFNYSISFSMKAGYTKDFKFSKYYRSHDPLNFPKKTLDLEFVLQNELNKPDMGDGQTGKEQISQGCVPSVELQDNLEENSDYKILFGKKDESINLKIGIDLETSTQIKLKDLEICKSCQIVKVIRSHHCSVCNQCVLKMDHHCPWINNCTL